MRLRSSVRFGNDVIQRRTLTDCGSGGIAWLNASLKLEYHPIGLQQAPIRCRWVLELSL